MNLKNAVVVTSWGGIDNNSRYDSYTRMYFFKTRSGVWLNYEPQQIKKAFLKK
jgi:hypothetical protein